MYTNNHKPKRRACVYTNRQRAVLSISRSSRHVLRLYIRKGITYSLSKHSW